MKGKERKKEIVSSGINIIRTLIVIITLYRETDRERRERREKEGKIMSKNGPENHTPNNR